MAGLDASHRGGRPGFVAVSNDGMLAFDDYSGNDMFQTLGNLTSNPAAAMLFVDFETAATLQLSGEAGRRLGCGRIADRACGTLQATTGRGEARSRPVALAGGRVFAGESVIASPYR